MQNKKSPPRSSGANLCPPSPILLGRISIKIGIKLNTCHIHPGQQHRNQFLDLVYEYWAAEEMDPHKIDVNLLCLGNNCAAEMLQAKECPGGEIN